MQQQRLFEEPIQFPSDYIPVVPTDLGIKSKFEWNPIATRTQYTP